MQKKEQRILVKELFANLHVTFVDFTTLKTINKKPEPHTQDFFNM